MRAVCPTFTAIVLGMLVSCGLAAESPKELAAAEKAFESNITLGNSLVGKPVSMEQVSNAEAFYQEAARQARQLVANTPDLAEAHRFLGLILCMGYRAVQVEQPADTQGGRPKRVFFLQRGGTDCEEGLGVLRIAMKLRPAYQVDYAKALLTCGTTADAEKQAAEAWKLPLPGEQRADCARVLALIARSGNRTQDEVRWLKEVVKSDPQDASAAARLAKLAPSPASTKPKTQNAIAWVEYETGMAQAAKKKKPMLIDFTAEWCGWCKKLEAEVFPKREMIALSKQFVCIRIDGDQRADLKAKYAVDGYPTAVILEHDGQELMRIGGYKPAEDYIADVKAALAAREAR